MQAGEIGTLEQLTIISRDPAPPPAAYVATSGGLFRDMTIHDFDMARFFLGDVVEVSASGSNLVSSEIAEAGDIDGAVVVLRGAGGDAANESLRTGASVKVGPDRSELTGGGHRRADDAGVVLQHRGHDRRAHLDVGRKRSAFLLTPPPMMIRSGDSRRSTTCR